MPELSVVVPAFRERDNIAALLDALEQALAGLDWETIVVVDDAVRRHEDAGARARAARPARALHAPHRPARPRLGVHRGHAGELGARTSR